MSGPAGRARRVNEPRRPCWCGARWRPGRPRALPVQVRAAACAPVGLRSGGAGALLLRNARPPERSGISRQRGAGQGSLGTICRAGSWLGGDLSAGSVWDCADPHRARARASFIQVIHGRPACLDPSHLRALGHAVSGQGFNSPSRPADAHPLRHAAVFMRRRRPPRERRRAEPRHTRLPSVQLQIAG